jgi:putative membrane protein
MLILAQVLVVLVALLHLYFLVLEMFLWTKPLGLKTFRNSPEKAETTRVLAANQGLYNGFLAAGLIWSLILGIGAGAAGRPVALFFLAGVVAVGVYGAATAAKKILYVQALPAAVAIAAVLFLA